MLRTLSKNQNLTFVPRKLNLALALALGFTTLATLAPSAHAADSFAGLGDLVGGNFSQAFGVSADGTVVVGYSYSANGPEAFRWTQAGGMVGLGDLAGGIFFSLARGVSADGTVVVGYSNTDTHNEAFRWVANSSGTGGVMSGLGRLGVVGSSYANGVSADGNVVVGGSFDGTNHEAFRWTQAGGMLSVASWLSTAGVSTAAWARLNEATATNSDGSVVVGYGTNASSHDEAFIARVANTGTGIVGLTDLTMSLAAQSAVHAQLEGLTSLTLNGAHHRPLMDMAMSDGQSCGWVSGDLGRVNSNGNGWTGLTEVGACHDFADKALRAGLGVGHSQSSINQSLNGRSQLSGEYVLAELDWNIPNTGLIASVLGMTGRWRADINRGYSAGTSSSKGDTDLNSSSLRARLDWKDAFSLGAVSFTPHAQYTATRTQIDGFQETGGTAPARFDSQSHTAKESRVGLTGAYSISDATTFLGRTEWVHRFDGQAASLSGDANVLNAVTLPFDIRGNNIRQNWVRVGADVIHAFSARNRLAISGNVSSAGQDADLSAGVSWNIMF